MGAVESSVVGLAHRRPERFSAFLVWDLGGPGCCSTCEAGFGMKIHYFSPTRLPAAQRKTRYFTPARLTLLRVSEFLTLHAPETPGDSSFHQFENNPIYCRRWAILHQRRSRWHGGGRVTSLLLLKSGRGRSGGTGRF